MHSERLLPQKLLRRTHYYLKKKYRKTPLWAFVSDLTGHGCTVSIALCIEWGWPPHQDGSQDLPNEQ